MTRLLQDYAALHASRRPDATALVFKGERLSYGELAVTSDRLARLLVDGGCKPGDRVCFLMPKSLTAIVAMLGILKAGCVYVPMDPASPPARLGRVVEASEPRWLLVSGTSAAVLDGLLEGLPHHDTMSIGCMDGDRIEGANFRSAFGRTDLASYPDHHAEVRRTSTDAAHILFTSGSTGQPKGVVITHANAIAFVEWAVPYFGMTSDDRTSGHSPLHFDLSTFDVYGSFAAGSELHLVPAELNLLAPKLADFIRSSELTQWFSVPSILAYMARFDVVRKDDFPALKRLLWCGEVFPTPPLMYWMQRLPSVTFTNLYGPTEATIASSYHTLTGIPASSDQTIPLGTACGGEELHVLDGSLAPVAPMEVGDLYISGAGLSPGYWRDQEKTEQVFRWLPGDDPKRIYRTGDLAHQSEDGLVWFHGRSDSQIKSRGYRIELGEIETALHTLREVRDCAVVAIATTGFEGAVICCAYVPAGDRDASPATIRSALSELVPGYMLPSRWLELDRLPKNVNGKTDRPSLQDTFRAQP